MIRNLLSAVIRLGWIITTLMVIAVSIRPVHASTFTIDAGDSAGLIAAIDAANDEINHPGPDTIELTGDILLAESFREEEEPYGHTGLPEITSEITIEGNGWMIARDHSLWNNTMKHQNFRVFTVAPTGNLTLHQVTVKGGYASSVDSCQHDYACGGGMYINEGSAIIIESTFTDNRAAFGAAIYNSYGTLVITQSQIVGNRSDGTGAGVENVFGSMTITDTLISDNDAYGFGGGVLNTGTTNLVDVTISNNSANGDGSGVYNFLGGTVYILRGAIVGNHPGPHNPGSAIYNTTDCVMTIEDSVIVANLSGVAAEGGGILNYGTLTMINVTLQDNHTEEVEDGGDENEGGGISNGGEGDLSVTNSMMTGNMTTVSASAVFNATSTASATIQNSCIMGNQRNVGSVVNAGENILQASNNWWGSPSGPSGAGSGTGDSVSENVDFSGFLTTKPTYCIGVPTLSTPASGPLAAVRPVFRWSAASGAKQYQIQINDTIYTVTTVAYTPVSPLIPGDYKWRVRAGNNGIWGNWSEMRMLTLTSPSDTAPLKNYFTTATPTLTWNRVSDATEYEIQVDDVTNFSLPLVFTTTVPANTLEMITSPLTNGTYYWHVRAKNGSTTGAWSAVDSFVVDTP